LAGDLASNNVARYNFITPDTCDDMHDSCPPLTNNILQGDNWLSNNLPTILNSRAYKEGGAVFITWDEVTSGIQAPIGMIVLSPYAKGGGYSNQIFYNHGSTLRTMEELFNVSPFLGGATNATDLSDLFSPPGPKITSFSPTPAGTEMLVLGVMPGSTNIVQCSTNFVDWTAIATNIPATNFFHYTNTAPVGLPQQFFRVVQMGAIN
jgi:hypothetical protein